MKSTQNSSENEAQEQCQNLRSAIESRIKKSKNAEEKRKVKSGNYNKYFGKSNTRHKLSKYLAGSNAISDLKAVNKHPDYDVEGVNVKNIKLERNSKTKDQGKKTESSQKPKSKAIYWNELRQVILKNETE